MTQSNLISIVTMWSKINELSRQSLSKMQIAMKLGISRDTVRRYQRIADFGDDHPGISAMTTHLS